MDEPGFNFMNFDKRTVHPELYNKNISNLTSFDDRSMTMISDVTDSKLDFNGKPNGITPFQHLLARVYPIASCCSGTKTNTGSHQREEMDKQDTSTSMRLPGFHRTPTGSSTSTHKKVIGEFMVNEHLEVESGWDRVKHMYCIKSGQFEDEYTQALNTMLYRTVIIGFFMNATTSSIKFDKIKKNMSKTEAMRSGIVSETQLPKTVFKSALKDTLKLSVISFSLLHMAHTIGAYKNKTSVWEFSLSSAVAFGVIGATKGLQKFGIYTLGGAVLGSVGGYVACTALQSSGYTQELRTLKRMKQKVVDQRDQEQSSNSKELLAE